MPTATVPAVDVQVLPTGEEIAERGVGDIVRNSLAPSVIRTLTPLLMAFVVTLLARANIDASTLTYLPELIGGAVSLAVYAVIRFFEEKGYLKIGVLLGWAKKPTYDAAARFDPHASTGIVATIEYAGRHRRA